MRGTATRRTCRGGPPTRILAVLVILFAVGAAWFAAAPAAQAHALVVSSDPAAGSALSRLPKAVTVTFSEDIVAAASGIAVVDGSGHVVSVGTSHLLAGSSLKLTVALPTLLGGVYTVRWHTVSSDDGHATSGSFTFGVGPLAYAAMAGPAPALLSAPSAATPASVAGTWVLDAGFGLLVGGCWIAAYGYPTKGRRPLIIALAGAGALSAGLAATGWSQAHADHIGLGELVSTSLGLGLIVQAVPGLLAAGCVVAALRLPDREAARGGLLNAALLLTGTAIGGHVLTTHAASGSDARLELAEQWVHVAAFATWIGGLAALLVTVGAEASPAKAAAVRRFSRVAGYSFAALCVSGVLRALVEVGAWSALANTLFGRLVVVKAGLLGGLALFGLYHRLRTVPAADSTLRGLRRVGWVELGVAGVALAAAAALSAELPPALVQAAAAQQPTPQVLVYATEDGVRASLAVSPDYPGPNRFTVRLTAMPSGRVLPASRLTGTADLAFVPLGRPTKDPDVLALTPMTDGSLTAVGDDQINLTGQWAVTARLKLPSGPADFAFSVVCDPSPDQIEQMTMGRMAMAFGIQLAAGKELEAYLTPARPGRDTLHLVFTDQRNLPIALASAPTVTVRQDGTGAGRTLTMRAVTASAVTRNDYYAASTYTAGRWDFHVTAEEPDGTALDAVFILTVANT
ncbi:MAG TPA: copper resistance protein CopC [Actinospica sp.]|jgi:copper transport protein|nr:copper resistance protein CopC [Actinospica sp.]